MIEKPKKVDMFYIDDRPDVSAIFVAKNNNNEILAEYEHKIVNTIEETNKAYNKALETSVDGKEFWKIWKDNVKKNKI